jgi:hypothetical protein
MSSAASRADAADHPLGLRAPFCVTLGLHSQKQTAVARIMLRWFSSDQDIELTEYFRVLLKN